MNKKKGTQALALLLTIAKFSVLAGSYVVFFIIFFSFFGNLTIYSGELKLNNAIFTLMNDPYGISYFDEYTGNKRLGYINYDKLKNINDSKEFSKIKSKFNDIGLNIIFDKNYSTNEDLYDYFKIKSQAKLLFGKITNVKKNFFVYNVIKNNSLVKMERNLIIDTFYEE